MSSNSNRCFTKLSQNYDDALTLHSNATNNTLHRWTASCSLLTLDNLYLIFDWTCNSLSNEHVLVGSSISRGMHEVMCGEGFSEEVCPIDDTQFENQNVRTIYRYYWWNPSTSHVIKWIFWKHDWDIFTSLWLF